MDSETIRRAYAADGFVLLPGAVDDGILDTLEHQFLGLVEEFGGRKFESAIRSDFAVWLDGEREIERKLYDGIRQYPWLNDFSMHETITGPVKQLLGDDVGLLEKIPFRIDLPMVMRELAVWHQDHFYVKGNTDTVTAWIPLQDTAYEVGCLLVMPGSHKLGALPHSKPLLQKKFVPSDIFTLPVRYVEMRRGDLLLVNALLLHSSGNNISDRIRFSVQARYSRMSQPCDPAMGRLIKL
jgi:hypothetical protein